MKQLKVSQVDRCLMHKFVIKDGYIVLVVRDVELVMFFLQYECFKPFEDKVAYSSVSNCQGVFTTVMLFFWGLDGDHEFFGVLLVQNER